MIFNNHIFHKNKTCQSGRSFLLQYLFEHSDEDLFNRRIENQAKMAHGKTILEEQSRIPKCSSCESSNISRIGVINRAVSFTLVGFASSKIGKTHKCNQCGTTW